MLKLLRNSWTSLPLSPLALCVFLVADLRNRNAVLVGGFNLELFDCDCNRLFLGIGDDGPEALSTVADQVNGPADHWSPLLFA